MSARVSDDRPLYEGAQSGLTVTLAYLLIFQYAMRHSLTAKAMEELLQLLLAFLPSGAAIPRSVHQMKKIFNEVFPEQQPTIQQYCSNCHKLRQDPPCPCNTGYSEFVITNLAAQLKARLQSRLNLHLHCKNKIILYRYSSMGCIV